MTKSFEMTEVDESTKNCILDVGGDVGERTAPLHDVVGLLVADAGLPSPERGAAAAAVYEEGYRVVTRARGKQKRKGKVPLTPGQPILFCFEQPAEVSKIRRAEDNPRDTTMIRA